MAQGTNFCFLPYHVHILARGEAAWEESDPVASWSAVWVGREYRQLHRAPIPLNRKPQDHVLRNCAWKPGRRIMEPWKSDSRISEEGGVDERHDGSVNRVWLYSDGCNPRHDLKYWIDYTERLGKLLCHLEPDTDKCTLGARDDDPCQPYFLNPRRTLAS